MEPITLAATILTVLIPYLAKAGESLAEEVGKKLPEHAGRLWTAIVEKFKGRPAAEEAAKDFAKNPTDVDNQSALRKEIRKVVEDNQALIPLFADLLQKAKEEAATQSNKIDGDNNVALNIGGNVQGNIVIGSNNKINDK